MLPFEDRYTRQRRLPEVGPGGQARLCAARFVIAPHAGADVELEYLARAGVSGIAIDEAATPLAFPFAAWFESDAALGVARGAWCALSRIKAELGVR